MSAALRAPAYTEAAPAPEETPQLRVLTCGSVDDGKSTLLGRLLFDTNAVFEDQLSTLDRESRRWGTQGDRRDFALLVDGLSAEREQGITIDVAYRYFSTKRRSFIVADTPGHEQYTRNMATGASMADLAIILVDARKGVLSQTRRHAFIVASLGVRHAVLAVNKMDLVGFSQPVWQGIVDAFGAATSDLGFLSVTPIPLCARDGDNIATRSARMPWYTGPVLLDHLETIVVEPEATESGGFRMPVQLVLRPEPEFRGYAGTIASGTMRAGQPVTALPSGARARIARIVTADGDLAAAGAGQAVTVTLDGEIDVSRGDVLAAADDAPEPTTRVAARLLWMAAEPLAPGRDFLVQLGPATANARVAAIRHAIDIQTYQPRPAETLGMNEIAHVELVFDKPLVAAIYAESRTLGALILVDRLTSQTAGMAVIEATSVSTPSPAAAARRWGQVLKLRQMPSRLLGGAVVAAIAGALTHDVVLAAVLGVVEVSLRPLLDRVAAVLWKPKADAIPGTPGA